MFKQNKLSLLILIHLLLLWYPQMIKSVHVHHDEHVCCHHDHGVSFDTPEDPCPVCDFEFVSFIENSPTRLQVVLPGSQVIDFPSPENPNSFQLFYFSLRAPPVT
jgi:hypothetical protein